MPKELIVSVNGREKKIAIVENGRVTEFYIERGESEQGIVGNIYKGRVMRVLPGMQSAFVDIGWSATPLYVSDFFDEEEEFERIVVDKKKTEGADDETATRAAAERVERARIERERQMESAQEQAEPDAEGADEEEEEETSEVAAATPVRPEAAPPSASRVEDAEEVAAAPREESQSGGRGRDGGRGRGRGKDRGETGAGRGRESSREDSRRESREGASPIVGGMSASGDEEIATPFVAGADSFERIVDEEESAAAEEGSAFKDARLQERMLDQIRAAEFDMDTTKSAEVGSLLGAGSTGGAGFERVDDGDTDAGTQRGSRAVRKEVAASVAHLAEEIKGEDSFAAGTQSFERVSDDEKAVEAVVESPAATTATAEKGRRGGGSKRGEAASERTSSKRGARKDSGAATTERAPKAKATSPAAEKTGGKEEAPTDKQPNRTRAAATASKKTASKSPDKSAAKSADKAPAKGRSRRGKAGGADKASSEDTDASVTSRPPRGEFARRGGRRRRGDGKTDKPGGENGDEQLNEQNGEAEVLVEETEVSAAAPPVETAPEPAAPDIRSRRERAPKAAEREHRSPPR